MEKSGSNHTGLIVFLLFIISSCEPKPTIVWESEVNADNSTVVAKKELNTVGEHRVLVNEVLNADKYTYLNVTEDDNDYWIAVPKMSIKVGGTYYYTGGLLKRNFESKEFNRVFDTIYLVSKIASHSIQSNPVISNEEESSNQKNLIEPQDPGQEENVTKLSDLFANPADFEGKQIRVTGKCVKVNPNIMNRNWVHIQDESEKELDLTITTMANIQVGSVVTLEGVISTNKDFGAGYKYEVIMENAVIK